MNYTVTVLHNVSTDMFFRYHPETSKLYHAHTFQVMADNTEGAANLIWTLANVDDADHLRQQWPHLSSYASQVMEYRARRNRSLSVSDVLVIYELRQEDAHLAGILAVAGVGHDTLDRLPEYVDGNNETEYSASYAAHQAFRLRSP